MKSNVIRQANDYFKIALCWHEASHVIVALLHLVRVLSIVLDSLSRDNSANYEIFDAFDKNNEIIAKTLALHEVQILYAGFVGEKLFYKEICGSDRFPNALKQGSWQDFDNAAKIIKKMKFAAPGKERVIFKRKIQGLVKDILVKYFADIQLIAHTLYKQRTLKEKQLKTILCTKSINKELWKKKFKEIKQLYVSKGANDLDIEYINKIISNIKI